MHGDPVVVAVAARCEVCGNVVPHVAPFPISALRCASEPSCGRLHRSCEACVALEELAVQLRTLQARQRLNMDGTLPFGQVPDRHSTLFHAAVVTLRQIRKLLFEDQH